MTISTPKYKIVLVEDDRFLRIAMKDKLEREGFQVFEATDEQKGLEVIKTQKPDLILLDLIMPIKSGFEVIEEVKKIEEIKKIPIIILSNLGQESDIEKSKTLGAVDYLVKADFKMKEIIEKVKKYLK